MGLGTRGTQRPCQHHLPEELNRKREALQLPLNPASASMRTLSHPIVKNWPETKGRQADKYSRLGLGKSWGFLYAHVTFEAVFRSLIPLAIWHICSLCFSFLVFFFLEAKFWLFFQEGRSKRASGTAGRPEGGSGTNIFTDHLPHSVPGLPYCRQILYQLSHKGSPRILERVAYPSSSGSSQPRNRTGVSCIAGRFFTN